MGAEDILSRNPSEKWRNSKILCAFPGLRVTGKSKRISQCQGAAFSSVRNAVTTDLGDLMLQEKPAETRLVSEDSMKPQKLVSEGSMKPQKLVSDDSVLKSPADEDVFSGLLRHTKASPLSGLDNASKLEWLASDLIGEDEEISTPFGKRSLVYADHAASGRSLFFVENFITQHVFPSYGNTHTDDSFVGRKTSATVHQAEEYIKAKLGGNEEDALIMCGWGCTAAIKRLQEVMGIAVPSILRGQMLEMMQGSTAADAEAAEERWLVFLGPYEHHSNLLSWRQSLAEVIEISATDEGMIDMQQLEAHLQAAQAAGRRRMLGSFSACSNVTGLLTDTRAVAALLHRYGAFACFDFAAGAPHIDLEMRSTKEDWFDAVVMSPHKLLGGPGAPGLLLMKKGLYKLGKNPPSTCGGGTVAYVNGFAEEDTLYYDKIEEREEGGTPPITGKVRCAMAFWLRDAMGISLIRKRETQFVDKVIERLYSHPNIEVLGGHSADKLAPIFSFVIITTASPPTGARRRSPYFLAKPLHGRFVVKLLNDLFGIQARGGCACAGPYGHLLLGIGKELSLSIRDLIERGYHGLKPGWSRLSLCYSMSEEELSYILSAIEFLAGYGARFLALYDFDWKSGNWTFSEEKMKELLKGHHVSIEYQPESTKSGKQQLNRQEHFRGCLRHALTLARILPRCAPFRPIPPDVDPDLVLFQA